MSLYVYVQPLYLSIKNSIFDIHLYDRRFENTNIKWSTKMTKKGEKIKNFLDIMHFAPQPFKPQRTKSKGQTSR